MNLDKKVGNGSSSQETKITELEREEHSIFEEMQNCRVAVNELMERLEGFSPEDEDILEKYSGVLDAAVVKFYDAEKRWIEAVNIILKARRESQEEMEK